MIRKVMLVGILLMSLTGCFGRYRIEFDEEDVVNCPRSAKAGETVTFETVIVCDADLYVYINDVELKPVREGRYEFVMPEEDVVIRTVIVSNGLA